MLNNNNNNIITTNLSLNFGPQHPAAHGVLRLIVHLEGENVKKIDPHIGLLHRGTEKLIEDKNYIKALPYFDRLDYVSTMSQEHCFSLIIEYFLNINITKRSSWIRIIFLEITRILNHLMAVTTHALDVGALTPFLWAFEERELLMEFYERVCGARLHAAYIIPGGVALDLPTNFLRDLVSFIIRFSDRINELELVLTKNFIWKYRLKDIGIISKNLATSFSFSGVLLRSSGIPFDLRESYPYELYDKLVFNIFVGNNGDCYDRYLMRIWEMKESLNIIKQCIILIKEGSIFSKDNLKKTKVSHYFLKDDMESMISHFLLNVGFLFKSDNSFYVSTETPKGEFGICLVVEKDTSLFYRCRIRAPGFFHIQGLNALAKKHMLADLVALIGTQDIVFGEIDR